MGGRTLTINGVNWPVDMVGRHLKLGILRVSLEFQYERKCHSCVAIDPEDCWWPADRKNFYFYESKGRLSVGECISCAQKRQTQKAAEKRSRPKQKEIPFTSSWEKLFDGVRTVSYEPYHSSLTSGKQTN